MIKKAFSFPDHNQNFWQLASIQSAPQSIPGLLIGAVLAQKYGALTAISSICIGNLLLWIIGLGIISINAQSRKNVIQVALEHLGKWGGYLVAIVLTLAFVLWYIIAIETTIQALNPVIPLKWGKPLGVILSIIIAILAIGGIRLIKWVCVIGLPVLLIIMASGLFYYGSIPTMGSGAISFTGVILIIFLNLPGFVNLSTFFRHASSRADSILGLSTTILLYILIPIPAIFIGTSHSSEIFLSQSIFSNVITTSFIIIAFTCLNLINIYLTSTVIEVLLNRFFNSITYFWIGIAGTISYLFYQQSTNTILLESLMSSFIINIGIALILSYLIKVIENRQIKRTRQLLSSGCWIIGCITTFLTQTYYTNNDVKTAALAGIWATIFSFMCTFFAKKSISSAKRLLEIAPRQE